MSTMLDIENVIHKARVEQMKGNIPASLLLYNQAMNMIDEKMETKLTKNESTMLSTYMNNVLEEFDLISNSNPTVHITEEQQQSILENEPPATNPPKVPTEAELKTPVTAQPIFPGIQQFPPAPYPNTSYTHNQPVNQPRYPLQPQHPYPPYYQQPKSTLYENQSYSNPVTKPALPTQPKPALNENGVSLLGKEVKSNPVEEPKPREPSQFEKDMQEAWNRGVQNVKDYMKDPHVFDCVV